MQRISQTQLMWEQVGLMFTSFVWTSVILGTVIFFWAIQDMQSNWNPILGIASAPTPTRQLVVYVNPTPSSTPWAVPSPTPTVSVETAVPSPTATRVVAPPSTLPDFPNQTDPTPVVLESNTMRPPAAIPALKPAPDSASAPASLEPGTVPDVPTRLVIPAVGIDSDIIPVGWDIVERDGQRFSIWHVADYAVGWHGTSALAGAPGNTVFAGHHNIKGEVFKNLVNVEVGDEIQVFTAGGVFTYTVELKTIVKEKGEPLAVRQKNAEWIAPTTDERITMVTCWPYTDNTHRVIVVAKPVK